MNLSGKTIAVVGNARALLMRRDGASIDAHDIVIRMNRAVPTDTFSQGSRTDLLVFSVFPFVQDIYRSFGASAYMWMSPKRRNEINAAMQLPDDLTYYPLDRWHELCARLGARPSVGAMTLDLVSAADPLGVSVYGFDFKQSDSVYETKRHVGPHDYGTEKQYCLDLTTMRNWNFVPC